MLSPCRSIGKLSMETPFISVTDRSFGAMAVTETPDRSCGALAGVATLPREQEAYHHESAYDGKVNK